MPNDRECLEVMRRRGDRMLPRSCPLCGLGPCRRGFPAYKQPEEKSVTNEQKAKFMVEQLKAIGFEARAHMEYGAVDDPERDPKTGITYTGDVYVQPGEYGHGQIKDLVTFAEYHYRTLKLTDGGVFYVVEDA